MLSTNFRTAGLLTVLFVIAGCSRPSVPSPVDRQFLTALRADLGEGFKDAIEAHKRGHAKPILKLSQTCKKYAEQLGERDWGAYKSEVEALAKRLGEASNGLYTTLKERAEAWGLGEGIDEKKKAEILGLNKYDWIERWQKILNEEIEKIKKKGFEF